MANSQHFPISSSAYSISDSATSTKTIYNFFSIFRRTSATLLPGNSVRQEFCAKVYPHGIRHLALNEVLLTLELVKPDDAQPLAEPLTVLFVVSILDLKGNKRHSVENFWNYGRYSEKNVTKLINIDTLKQLRFILAANGQLNLRFDISVLKQNNPIKQSQTLSSNLNSLCESERLSDLTLVLDGNVQIPAHKLILVARSRVFAKMIEEFDGIEKRENRILIPGVEEDVFRAFLRYLYTGKVEQLDQFAFDLLELAEKYETHELKEMCEAELCGEVSPDTVCRLLLHADMYNAAVLRNRCQDFFEQHFLCNESWVRMVRLRPELRVLIPRMGERIQNRVPTTSSSSTIITPITTLIMTTPIGRTEFQI